ncbi:branched-chain amino acid ABC transporter permease [Pseudonocardia sp. DSM 110487]|uniref:branched-chain amino acid ABC transporter permease n=1 Tax=Pseudonocardia sp. DSM 110487 TaxID=2865833 RepID=UPI001C6A1987|nr:branched-chain amino acid ABC transporter permease [Pseudonocardia sp. DSM 110487]QYN37769.1 branched-chain amino acid ABC transporter permease [Pseudonocardia sp. DSM 110487]
MTRPKFGYTVAGAVAAGSCAVPLLMSRSQLTIYILLGLAIIVTTGLSLLMGYAGQVSLGQGAFYAIGAYTAGLMAVGGLPPLLGLAAAPVFAAAVAAAVGIPLLRLRGHYLAFATLAVQLILLSLVGQFEFTGGDIGLRGIPQLGVGDATLTSSLAYAYVTWVAAALALLLARNVIRSRPGRGLRALASTEIAAKSAGVPVGRYKLAAFSLSAAYAGLAGGIYAFYLGYISPGSFPVLISIEFVVMAVVGGLGTVWGPVVGATLVTLLVQALNALGTMPGMPPYAPSVLSYAVYALLLVLVLLFMPRGLLPSIAARLEERRALAREPARR